MTAPNTPEGVYATAVVAADSAHSQAVAVLDRLREVEPDNKLIPAASAKVTSCYANLSVQVALLAVAIPDSLSVDGVVLRAYVIAAGHRDDIPVYADHPGGLGE